MVLLKRKLVLEASFNFCLAKNFFQKSFEILVQNMKKVLTKNFKIFFILFYLFFF